MSDLVLRVMMKREKKRTLNAARRRRRTESSGRHRRARSKKKRRERICAAAMCWVLPRRDSVSITFSLTALSLSPSPTSRTLSCYQSINTRKTYRTRKERKFVVEPFVRPSVHLSIRCCLFSAALLLCMYVCIYFPHIFFLSLALCMLWLYVCASMYSYWWSKGCSEVIFALARSFYIHCPFFDTMQRSDLLYLGLDKRADRQAIVVHDPCFHRSICI